MAVSKSVKPRRGVLAASRNQLGWSQEELARRAECGVRSVRKVEAGRPISPGIAAGLAATVGIPYACLIEGIKALEWTIALLPPRPAMIVGRLVQEAATEVKERLKREKAPLRVEKSYIQPDSIHWDETTYRGDAYPVYAWACDVAEVEVDDLTAVPAAREPSPGADGRAPEGIVAADIASISPVPRAPESYRMLTIMVNGTLTSPTMMPEDEHDRA